VELKTLLAVIYQGDRHVAVCSTWSNEFVVLLRELLQKNDPSFRVVVEEFFKKRS